MELNKVNKGKVDKKIVLNAEGSIVLDRPKEVELYLRASGLNIKGDSFYETADEKLQKVMDLAKEADNEFLLGLASFLADKGLKLSPVVLLSVLSSKHYSFKDTDVQYVFNTPARIAEALALNKYVKLNNSFKKHVLRPALENMNEITLKKNKMQNRKIKLADVIKYLRPKPKASLALLYKAIIENNKKITKLDTKTDFLALKSSLSDDDDKREELADMVLAGTVPINQLIRNLKYLAEQYDFTKQRELESAVMKTLMEFKNYRILNMFDVIQAAIYVPHFEKALFEVVKRYVQEIRTQFNYEAKTTFLFDVSGSMHGDGGRNGFRYLALLTLLFDESDIRFFSDDLHEVDIDSKRIIANLKLGNYSAAKTLFDDYVETHSGGTALLASLEALLDETESKHICVISDEVSWEESDLTGYIDKIANYIDKIDQLLSQRKLTLINPQVSTGTVFRKKVVAIASLTSTILFDIAMMNDPKGFMEHIKNYKHNNPVFKSVMQTKDIIRNKKSKIKKNMKGGKVKNGKQKKAK